MAGSERCFRAVLFDLDGTLIDSLEDIAGAANQALRDRGYPAHPVEAYRQFVGEGVRMLFRKALAPAAGTNELLDELSSAFAQAYEARWHATTRPYAGIDQLLDALATRKLPLAVLSNKPDQFTRRCVAHFFGRHQFARVLGQRETAPRKPDPAGALEIARGLGLPPDSVVYVGDSSTDMQTAVRAGMYPVGVTWGFREAAELRAHGAARIIDAPAELLPIVDAPPPEP